MNPRSRVSTRWNLAAQEPEITLTIEDDQSEITITMNKVGAIQLAAKLIKGTIQAEKLEQS